MFRRRSRPAIGTCRTKTHHHARTIDEGEEMTSDARRAMRKDNAVQLLKLRWQELQNAEFACGVVHSALFFAYRSFNNAGNADFRRRVFINPLAEERAP